jgi:hypothetical protein
MQTNALSPAYPITPLQDNFGRMVVPVAGLSKLEYFALELYKQCYKDLDALEEDRYMDICINSAITFLNHIEEKHKNISNEKDSVLDIIQ